MLKSEESKPVDINENVSRKALSKELKEYVQALEEEIEEINKSGQSSTLLNSGRKVVSNRGDFWYRFNVNYMPSLPADTPCKLTVGIQQYDVKVVSVTENSLVISTGSPLPDMLSKAKLENGATVLMERLIQCIEKNSEVKHRLWDKVLNGDYCQDKDVDKELEKINIDDHIKNTKNQNKAIKAAISGDVTYIWGPPGTGKTYVIGQIIDEIYRRNQTVLVVSHTNTAVDGAINKAYGTYKQSPKFDCDIIPILRYGNASKDMPKEVCLSSHIEKLSENLIKEETILKTNQKLNSEKLNKINTEISKIDWVNSSEISLIDSEFTRLKLLENKSEILKSEYNAVEKEVNDMRNKNPEYEEFDTISRELKKRQNQFTMINAKTEGQSKFLEEAPKKIEVLRDEIKKHDIYQDLSLQVSKFMSQTHLINEIHSSESKKQLLQNEVKEMLKKEENLKKYITAHEEKSSFAKLFSSKKVLEDIKNSYEEIIVEINEHQNMHKRLVIVENDYRKQLDDLLVLEEKMKVVKPSETKEYWNGLVQKLLRQINIDKSQLPKNKLKCSELKKQIDELKSEYNKLNVVASKIDKKLTKLRELQFDMSKNRNQILTIKNDCSKLIENEVFLCTMFKDDFENKDMFEQYQELRKFYKRIKIEIEKSNLSELKEREKQLSEQQKEIISKLEILERKKAEIEKEVIEKSKIVGTTLAKSYLSENLRNRTFDTVILDEASMASIPTLWCASLLAEKNVVIVGDFLQLPPIVLAKTNMAKKWLGKDIFFHSGIYEKDKLIQRNDFFKLDEQFRMESDIAEIANMYYGTYDTELKSNDTLKERVNERTKFYDWYPYSQGTNNIRLIGTESLNAWVTGVPRGKSHSRLNCFSAALVVDLAFRLIDKKLSSPETVDVVNDALVLIVVPYRPHADHIKKLIEFGYTSRGFKEDLGHIQVGTIHSFQGRDADIVIFDLVIDQPHWKANLFMPEEEMNENLKKMFNVAITRARFKMYIVGNFEYCRKKAKNNALSQLLDKLIDVKKLVVEDAKLLFPDLVYAPKHESELEFTNAPQIICREDSFEEYFLTDIKLFTQRLIIYSPFITSNRLGTLLPYFVDAIKVGKQIIVVTKALSDRNKSEVNHYIKLEGQLKSIGVSVIHKQGMHEKLIFVDSKAIWNGSLNALSFSGNTGELMHRFMNEKVTTEYEKLFDIKYIIDAVNKKEEQICPICGEELQVRESGDGGIYWSCINKDYTRNKDQQYPSDGILRCKICDSAFIYSRKKQPRWICTKNPKHYQILRESDLKLEKMLELIPSKKELAEIKKYYDLQRKKHDTKSKKISSGKIKNKTEKSTNQKKMKLDKEEGQLTHDLGNKL